MEQPLDIEGPVRPASREIGRAGLCNATELQPSEQLDDELGRYKSTKPLVV